MEDDRIEDPYIKFVPRTKWGALPPKFTEPLPLPAQRMLIEHTNTERCMSKVECIKAMRTMQKYYMDVKGMPDLPYSFLIGGDLRVYEGRGWGVMIRRRDQEDWVDERVVFGLIGHVATDDKRMDDMIQKAYDLMYHAISNDYLVDFDQYGFQDEEARKNEEQEFQDMMMTQAEKECKEEREKAKKKSAKKNKENKKWNEHINEVHYADAEKPAFFGNKEELDKVMEENKELFKQFDLKHDDKLSDVSTDSSDYKSYDSDHFISEAEEPPP